MSGRTILGTLLGVGLGTLIFICPSLLPRQQIDYSASAPADAVSLAKSASENLRAGKFEAVQAILHPKLGTIITPDLFAKMKGAFPAAAPRKIIVAGWRTTLSKTVGGGDATSSTEIVVSYQYPDRSEVHTEFVLQRAAGKLLATGFHVRTFPAQPAHANDLDPTKLQPFSIAYMAIAFLIDIFAAVSFVSCAMGPLPRWRTRWLWMIATLIGVVRYDVVLTTGAATLLPVYLNLPPAGLSQADMNSPWVVWLTLPVGAVVYWYRRGDWRQAKAAEPARQGSDMRG